MREIGQKMQPLEIYKLVEDRYDTVSHQALNTFNNTLSGNVPGSATSKWCPVKDQVHNYIPYSNKHLDAGCGKNCRGTVGFDLRDGVSFRQALDIYQPGSFDTVTAYGSLHSALNITRTPRQLVAGHIDTDDASVLFSESSVSSIDTYTVDNNIMTFHAACLANWTTDYVGITIRTRYADFRRLKVLANGLGMISVAEFEPNLVHYTQSVIEYYLENSKDLDLKQRIELLQELFVIKTEYTSSPPIGVVWRK